LSETSFQFPQEFADADAAASASDLPTLLSLTNRRNDSSLLTSSSVLQLRRVEGSEDGDTDGQGDSIVEDCIGDGIDVVDVLGSFFVIEID
jgi:hypothetical protein